LKAVIIAGGLGTRLRPLTNRRPKHLLPLANRPFLEYQIALLHKHGITEITFATNYMADKIESHFEDGAAFGVSLNYAIESEPLGTGGAIRNAVPKLRDKTIIVLNGDILTDFDLSEIISLHRDRRAHATIALRAVPKPHPFGVLETATGGRILSWNEPTEAQKKAVQECAVPETDETDLINAGIYILEADVVRAIPSGRAVSAERETFPKLLKSGARVFGVESPGYWIDVGRPEQYRLANQAVLSSAVQTEVIFERISPTALVASDADIDDLTSIGPGSKIGAGTRLSRSIILGNVTVGANCSHAGLIADEGTVLESDTTSQGGAVIAAGSVIARGTRL
jgi:mannose-1-phosphate guanylyltransferase